jgi:hypothetical protein
MKNFVQILVTIITAIVFLGAIVLVGVGISIGQVLLSVVSGLIIPAALFFLYNDFRKYFKK